MPRKVGKCAEGRYGDVPKLAQTCPTSDLNIKATAWRNSTKLGSLSSYECPLCKEHNSHPECQSGQPVGPKDECPLCKEHNSYPECQSGQPVGPKDVRFNIEATARQNLTKLGSLSSYECSLCKEHYSCPKCQSGHPVGQKNVCTHIRGNRKILIKICHIFPNNILYLVEVTIYIWLIDIFFPIIYILLLHLAL
jgi:hypothetical protein